MDLESTLSTIAATIPEEIEQAVSQMAYYIPGELRAVMRHASAYLPTEVDFVSVAVFLLYFAAASLILGIIGRVVLGKRSSLNHSLSSIIPSDFSKHSAPADIDRSVFPAVCLRQLCLCLFWKRQWSF